jgi:hypothetical protein
MAECSCCGIESCDLTMKAGDRYCHECLEANIFCNGCGERLTDGEHSDYEISEGYCEDCL